MASLWKCHCDRCPPHLLDADKTCISTLRARSTNQLNSRKLVPCCSGSQTKWGETSNQQSIVPGCFDNCFELLKSVEDAIEPLNCHKMSPDLNVVSVQSFLCVRHTTCNQLAMSQWPWTQVVLTPTRPSDPQKCFLGVETTFT